MLGTMEAMKMELALTAPFAGTVAAVDAKAGEQVALGARLFLVEQSLVERADRRTRRDVIRNGGHGARTV